ncbi:MAG: fatty acid desaturase [Pandoraea sp.]|nr:fatty acid desaturase [Pandoraea sp.]MDR3399298.1 fatty acid desaturase [Pandoraea sp.]
MTAISPKTPTSQVPTRWWQRYEAPTLVLALLLYSSWAILVRWHAAVPGWLLFLLGGYIAQLHFSLQHEAIHAMRHLPKRLRWALVWPPLNLWLPYPMYHRSHSTHHVNFHLTHPEKDTESVYHSPSTWGRYGRFWRAIYLANQTLAVRLLFGPFLRLYKLVRNEVIKLAKGNFSDLRIWLIHLISILPILYYVISVCHMGLGEYLLYFVYPGMMLGQLRTFTEHRWGDSPHERVAIVESNSVFGILYLYNNLHYIHHKSPTMPWYEIPGHFRRNRHAAVQGNGNFYYRGYGQIARRYLFRPVFHPEHPRW